jgi:type I restriction enzyme S subunit
MLCDTVYRFRCDTSKVYPDYLELILNSPAVVSELDRRKSGISDSGISLNHGKVKTIPIRLVGPLDEQKKLVEVVQQRLGSVVRLEQEIELNLLKAETLRQSILKKAFSGQLVPQDPSDEPAETLLERIRSENEIRLNPSKTSKGRRRKLAGKSREKRNATLQPG